MNHTELTVFDSHIVANHPLVGNIVELVIARPDGFSWQAGDYLWLGLNEDDVKPFSIANVLTEDTQTIHFDIAVTDALTEWWQALLAASHCKIKGPVGQYHWPTGQTPVYLLAGGTGITPLLALLRAHEAELADRVVTLYWGVRQSEWLFVEKQLNQLMQTYPKFHWQAVISEADAQWKGAQGNLPDVLMQAIIPDQASEWLICGPWPMVRLLKDWLINQGIDLQQIQ